MESTALLPTGLSAIKFILVGFGPHCLRTYISFFRKYNMEPAVIVELESGREAALALIRGLNWQTVLLTVDDEAKDNHRLPPQVESQLDEHLAQQAISHAIVASEPKGHLMYLRYFLSRGTDILTDKPILALRGMTSPCKVDLLKNIFHELVAAQTDRGVQLKILCQRSEHVGYKKIARIIGEVISRFDIPVTHIAVNTCDGNWLMPHDLNYENHPYKYGYGKLFHSGYHYIALLAGFIELNGLVSQAKKIVGAELGGQFLTPDDLQALITPTDLAAIFSDYKAKSAPSFNREAFCNYGECDFISNLRFMNASGNTITTASLNVLQTGFSRRAWHQTKADRYKGNGRVRHENVNIQVGPLLNVQVHSYQAKECKDRGPEEWQTGGLDHFDIDVYRNSELIGGPPHERFSVKDLHDFSEEQFFVGLNELARERAILDFFYNLADGTDIGRHLVAMEIFCQICRMYADFSQTRKIETRGFPLKICEPETIKQIRDKKKKSP